MNACGSCGAAARHGGAFCETCGAPLRAAVGAAVTAQYSVPLSRIPQPDPPRPERWDLWTHADPAPTVEAAPASAPPISAVPPPTPAPPLPSRERRWAIPLIGAVALVLLITTLVFGLELRTTSTQLSASRGAVTRLTHRTHDLQAVVSSDEGRITDLQSNATRLRGIVSSCQRAAGVIARTWELTDRARRWTLQAVGAAAVGDYLDATYYLQQGNALMERGGGLLTGAGGDLKTCANGDSGGSGSGTAL
jgi:hypothetical protein